MQGKHLLELAAKLRGQGEFHKAIDLIENNRSQFADETLFLAAREAFLAAHEARSMDEVRKYAREMAEHEPEHPDIQPFLS